MRKQRLVAQVRAVNVKHILHKKHSKRLRIFFRRVLREQTEEFEDFGRFGGVWSNEPVKPPKISGPRAKNLRDAFDVSSLRNVIVLRVRKRRLKKNITGSIEPGFDFLFAID